MVKDGEDWHGLQTTKMKNLGKTFQTVYRDCASFSCCYQTKCKFENCIYLFNVKTPSVAQIKI